MEEKEAVRVRLEFGDRHLLTKEQRSQGFDRSWAAISPELATVADFARDIISRYSLSSSALHGLVFSMDGFALPSFESTSVFRDNDIIRVHHKTNKNKNKKTAVATIHDEHLQTEAHKVIHNQTVSSDDANLLNESPEYGSPSRRSNKKKNKAVLTGVTGTKRKREETERPEDSKSKEVICTGQNASSEHRHGQEFHNGDAISKKEKSMMLRKFKDKFIETNGTTPGSKQRIHRNDLDDPDAPTSLKEGKKSWNQSDGHHERNLPLRISNSASTDEEEEFEDKDDIDFESLCPLTCLPTEGDIIAYRLVEMSSGRPQLSVFRVGKVIKFDPITMLTLLDPVPQYPIFSDGERSESQKSRYKEDGSLEIDFGSLVDLHLVEESKSGTGCSKSKFIAWENGTGFHSGGFNNNMNTAWKTAEACNDNEETRTDCGAWTPNISRDRPSWQGMGQRGSKIQSRGSYRGRNGGMHKNVNSHWQAGVEEYGQRSAVNNSRHGRPKPGRGQNGDRFGPYDSFSRRMNDRAGNDDNSSWEAYCETTNANEPTQTQENGWDTWTPNTSRPSASWSRMGQNTGGFGSRGGFSRGTKRGRGGRYSNPKFCK